MSEERFQRIECKLDAVAADVAGLKTDVAGIYDNIDGLGRQMRVLHEDTLDRIRALNGYDALREEMRAGFQEVLRRLADHAVPGDAADRQFALRLDNHEQRIQALEHRGPAGR